MRLFYQLTEQDQNSALHYCADIVVEDLIEDGVKLEPITKEDVTLKEKLDIAVAHMKMLSTYEEKASYLMSDTELSKAIYEIALEMAKSTFYHDDEELVIYLNTLKKVDINEADITDPLPKKPKKVPQSLN
jgi:hypothetical protein